jgi:hypothetical protein
MKKIVGVMIVFMFLSGCTYHWANIDLKPNGSDLITPYAGNKKIVSCVAIMNDLRVKSNGQDVNASSEFHKRFVINLKDTNIFESVVFDMPTAKPEKYVNFTLSVNENQDTNQGANMAKGFFIGLTLYLLTPVLPLSYDFESEMLLNATRWDGKTKQYVTKGKGSASYHLFANPIMAGQEVRNKVTNNNLNALMNQLIRDTDFLYGL